MEYSELESKTSYHTVVQPMHTNGYASLLHGN
uniref:Uncharacterized protein n=1 Tax=Arundo donax TaxID=35708 RepID=A0A0A9AEX7_ARUDO